MRQGFLGPQLRDIYLSTGSPETPLSAATGSSFFPGLGCQTWTVSSEAGALESILSLGASWAYSGHSWATLRLEDCWLSWNTSHSGPPLPAAPSVRSSPCLACLLGACSPGWATACSGISCRLRGGLRVRACSKPKKKAVLLVEASLPNPGASPASPNSIFALW